MFEAIESGENQYILKATKNDTFAWEVSTGVDLTNTDVEFTVKEKCSDSTVLLNKSVIIVNAGQGDIKVEVTKNNTENDWELLFEGWFVFDIQSKSQIDQSRQTLINGTFRVFEDINTN